MRFDTQLIHAGEIRPRIAGAVSMPIFQSSTYEGGGGAAYDDVRYIRMNNTPNHVALHGKVAALEGAEDGLVASSGMAAISSTLLSLLSPGDHLIAMDCLYGGTRSFIAEDLVRLGIQHTFVSGTSEADLAAAAKPNTRVLYVESITNPTMEVPQIDAVLAIAKRHQWVSVIDNTFTSPANFRAVEYGFDLAVHSGSKYLNGHTDIVAGAVAGSSDLIGNVRKTLNHLGGTLDPHACFLLHRGMKTLALRMHRHNASALRVAEFLAQHPGVSRVNYPGLPDHPAHDVAARLFDGCGGMLSFEPCGDGDVAEAVLDAVTLPIKAPSLGGVETLISRPSMTSHSEMPAADRRRLGISDALIRLSVGIEDVEDIMADIDRALRASITVAVGSDNGSA
jgi:cystathionine beta-lyase/cystathionine gamma-synthase